jgi:hypothetical protein
MSWLAGLPAATQASIMRSMNYANPVQPAAADTLSNNGNPLNNPSPVPAALAGGGPPVPPGLVSGGQPPAPMPPGAPTPPVPGQVVGGSSGGAGASPPIGPSILPQARGVMPVMGPPMPPGPSILPQARGVTPDAYPAVAAPLPPPRPRPVSNPAVARGSNRPAGARIPGSATALAPAPGNSPFVPIAAQNQDWSGGALSRYGPSGFGRQATALDLSRLFNRS